MQRLLTNALFLLMLSLGIGTAHAAGSATISSSDGETVRMDYLDDKLSMNVGAGSDRMVLRDGKMFMISGDTVIDAGSMMSMVGQQMPALGPDDVDQFKSLKASGRSETVAGINGEVHVLTYVDGEGNTQSRELVLSKDPRAVELMKAFSNMTETMAQLTGNPMPAGGAEFEAALRGYGMLRADSDFRVVSFNDAPAASRFELPSAPQSMPNMQGQMGGGANAEAGAEASGGGFMGGLFGQKAQRQQERVEQRSDQEVDEATDSMVDKAMDKAFGKLFGN